MRLATDTERVVFAGRTGTGKSTEALHELSQRSIDEMPWILMDFKQVGPVSEAPVNGIVSIHEVPPREPGLWTVKVRPEDYDGRTHALSAYLGQVLEQGETGVFIDEGQLLGQQNRGLRDILILGRSARTPLIFLCQRTTRVETSVWSESEILHFFMFQHPRDYENVADYADIDPEIFNASTLRGFPDHYSFRFEPRHNRGEILPPCPPFEEIYQRILTRLPTYEDAYDGGHAALIQRERRVRV